MLWSKVIGAGGAGGVVEGWNVSTAVFLQSKSVGAQELDPNGLSFKSDGLKMYILGAAGDDVNEYNLSPAWDVSTAVFLQSKSISAQDLNPRGLFFKPDGTKMYFTGFSGDDVNEYDLSTAWNVSTAEFLQSKSVGAQDTLPFDVSFKSDGLKMYILGAADGEVNEYDLSTAWNVSTAVFNQALNIQTQENGPRGLFFKPDGLKMYIAGVSGVDVNEYDLSTAWNVSTAVFLQSKSVSAQDTQPYNLFFKPDGTKMYFVGDGGNSVYEYDLTA